MRRLAVPPGLLRDPGHCLALGFGAGLAPRAPGTCGAALGLAVYGLCAPLGLGPAGHALLVAALFALGLPLCDRTAKRLGVTDHPAIVWDEVVGMLATLGFADASLPNALAGFALFRLFDIWKPWPIRLLDARLHGGLGIMLDDLVAGCFAGVMLALFEYLS